MISTWKTFLVHSGASIKDDKVVHFGQSEQELHAVGQGHILCDLSHLGFIKASGEDVRDFLQGQFSNDIKQVSESHSQISAYCNPKGRMLANFRIFKWGDDYYLRLPNEVIAPTLQRLRMYILRSRAELTDVSDTLVRIGYYGLQADAKLRSIIATIPNEVDACISEKDLKVLRVPGLKPRFEIYGSVEALQPIWNQLIANDATPVGAAHWSLLDILSGIPNVLPQTREAFVPQMANMDLVDGLSFRKGCYPGQEIVARMRYLGTLKRRMYRLHLDSEIVPQPGDEIFVKDDQRHQPIGKIVDAQAYPEGGCEALAVLQIHEAQNAILQLGSQQEVEISLTALPYALDSA